MSLLSKFWSSGSTRHPIKLPGKQNTALRDAAFQNSWWWHTVVCQYLLHSLSEAWWGAQRIASDVSAMSFIHQSNKPQSNVLLDVRHECDDWATYIQGWRNEGTTNTPCTEHRGKPNLAWNFSKCHRQANLGKKKQTSIIFFLKWMKSWSYWNAKQNSPFNSACIYSAGN